MPKPLKVGDKVTQTMIDRDGVTHQIHSVVVGTAAKPARVSEIETPTPDPENEPAPRPKK